MVVNSFIGGFCGSPVNFHAKDGSGYKLVGELVATPMVSAFSRWRRCDETRQILAKILHCDGADTAKNDMSVNGLSEENVLEIASNSLAYERICRR
ncbi:Peptidase M1, alanyl aminopeptidase, C-terminal [Dillenia turbinata]|uniref:Peptidase M1, alanyl aminopeptidase, C-terminal n=1 Tax=Dillenia turbinata TaxID=194707 RepID=A0AAN8ZWM5_9MAGN